MTDDEDDRVTESFADDWPHGIFYFWTGRHTTHLVVCPEHLEELPAVSPVPGLGQDLHLHREGAGLHPGALVHNVLGRQWSTRDSTGITRLET